MAQPISLSGLTGGNHQPVRVDWRQSKQHLAEAATCMQVESFYEYYEGLQEGWDGPALLVFASQGKIGARLDRNGLRPARYWKTTDDLVYVASEVGVLNDVLDNAPNITTKGRLGPGQVSHHGWPCNCRVLLGVCWAVCLLACLLPGCRALRIAGCGLMSAQWTCTAALHGH